ncbi:4'-phosphopantetheinyl transferase superfamily protein [Acetobacterium sp.]|uniref:4'-phosphopantetheinyl transferase family protein n=1 Tax=Acetobacterium sp. TaxID=1872094 RepID=UPI00271EB9ED|nr:4'-phosphopantetheinyl transferase superfamily protein [Acetobacterium sp.]MDO9492449.1 4'-phosphopantetheinyl transferase superfamily protein [Acetobacterium sp.]
MEIIKTRIFIADVCKLNEPCRLAAAMQEVSQARREKAARLKTAGAKALSVGAEMLLQQAVERIHGISGSLRMTQGEDGKPILSDYPDIHFNLSHSGHYVVCSLGSQPVGVDIQKMELPNLKLARRFFAQSEADWLFSLSAENQTQGFYDLWALKEAYMKYTGKGFNLPMHAFRVDCQNERPINPGTAIVADEKKIPVVIKNFPDLENYVLWSVTDTIDFQEKIEWIGL